MIRRLCLLSIAAVLAGALSPAFARAQDDPKPRTGFERSGGADWTTHQDEVEFLAAVDAQSERVEVDVIGETARKRPLHLVQLGSPQPVKEKDAQGHPTILFVCSQHGNEPAGREACLRLLRDLAFTNDPALVEQLASSTILFVPSANPDGRASNTRGNSGGTDINRDHLNLETPEARAVAEVVRDWQPDVVLDLHEYGPSIPALYDDEVLFLWPRNLNVDERVHDMALTLAYDYIKKDAEEAGYTADEYGQYAVADQDIHQSAGDGDEGILRNAMGLRNAIGILVETAVTEDPRNGPQEVVDGAALNNRRVESHYVVSQATLRFMRELGADAMQVTADAFLRMTDEGAKQSTPVYFGGADNQEPTEDQIADPPPCAYQLSHEEAKELKTTLSLLAIDTRGTYVSMAQPSEPLIPLLLDERGIRSAAAAKPLFDC